MPSKTGRPVVRKEGKHTQRSSGRDRMVGEAGDMHLSRAKPKSAPKTLAREHAVKYKRAAKKARSGAASGPAGASERSLASAYESESERVKRIAGDS